MVSPAPSNCTPTNSSAVYQQANQLKYVNRQLHNEIKALALHYNKLSFHILHSTRSPLCLCALPLRLRNKTPRADKPPQPLAPSRQRSSSQRKTAPQPRSSTLSPSPTPFPFSEFTSPFELLLRMFEARLEGEYPQQKEHQVGAGGGGGGF
ncbi:uncharacterized protein EKO05_0001114 [Ascochyta rabiei]|uniref:uncharacterized protein n=1 Tax=Didymella rabiei TaxID=5454 RepID=UPI0021FBF02E|nr:uncharacterized protein EKO05_0001114 [Ascochyta rabiei]UPX10455.1 hypothetical protein EKO05_0001114 [Ascochyta rabiei]